MPGRLLADVDALGMEILRSALAEFQPALEVVEQLPVDPALRYPLVVGYRLPGGGAVDPRFLDRALYQVDVYDDDPNRARDLAGWCRTALFEAVGRPYRAGSVSEFAEQAAPAVVPRRGAPVGEIFIPATYQLYVCP